MASASSGAPPGMALPRARFSGALNQPHMSPPALPVPIGARRSGQQQPTSHLTWSFAFCALFAMGAFFVAHVMLSSYLISEDMVLERERLAGYRRQQLAQFRQGSMAQDAGGMKRILVLGSHHTGTSIVTRLIMECGAFAGDDLVMLPGNDLKYNEYRPAVEADKRVMSKGKGNVRVGPHWVDYGFSWDNVPVDEQQLFLKSVDRIVHDLDTATATKQKRAWVLKDPRMSLLAEHWVGRSPNSICVLVVRNPAETSIRLAKKYNRPNQSLKIVEWIEFWAQSMIAAARACARYKRRIVFAYHSELTNNPVAFAQKLENDLFGKVRHFSLEESIFRILGAEFKDRSRVEKEELGDQGPNSLLWTPSAAKTYHALMKRDVSSIPLARPMLPIEREAYATIITSNNRGFVAGAIALAASIRRFDKERDLVAMLSTEVQDDSVKNTLSQAGWRTVEVSKLKEPWYETHPNCSAFSESQKVRWGRMFSKLQVYSLPYERILYLDTDTLVLRDCGDIFRLPGNFYGERSPSHRGINAGIMLLRPSTDILDQLIQYARDNEPMQFWKRNQVGCTEQELLNRFWNGSDDTVKLNNTRHFDYLSHGFLDGDARIENRLHGPRIAHCLTTKCPKPWEVDLDRLIRVSPLFDEKALPGHCDRLMYLEWYRIFLSPETLSARKALAYGTDDAFKALAIPVQGSGYDQVANEVLEIGGPDGENFRRNWRADIKRTTNQIDPVGFDLRKKKKPIMNNRDIST